MTLEPEATRSHEVMECREGCTIIKAQKKNLVYLFGGRNRNPLSKMESFDPHERRFRVIKDQEAIEVSFGRFNHSCIEFKN